MEYFSKVFYVDIKCHTIGDIIAGKDKQNDRSCKKSNKSGKLGELEKALFLWFTNIWEQNMPIMDQILREKVK